MHPICIMRTVRIRIRNRFEHINTHNIMRNFTSFFNHLSSYLKSAAFFLLLTLSCANAWGTVTYCASSAFGYGASATGGSGATPVLVYSVSELKAAVGNKAKNKVVIIANSLTFTSKLSIQDGENVTILGLPGVTLTSLQQDKETSGIFYVKRFNNLIIRNLTFIGPGAYDCNGEDLLCFEKVTNAWVDHCDFQDGCDGNFDNKSLTDNVTVSWCRFRYLKAPKPGGTGGSDDHRFTNLLGSSSSDAPSDGTYNFTWAYCWWDNGCKERMVRCRNCELHFMNCYWNSSVANYYVGPENAKCYFEGCTFEGKANTNKLIFKSYGGTNACYFTDCSGNLPSNSGTVPNPHSSYTITASGCAEAKTAVTNATCGAGATLTVTTAGVISSACDGGAPAPTVYTVTWNANGGSCGTPTSSVTSGNAIGSLPEATKDGYTFDGWYTDPSSGTKISAATTVTADITYYAHYTSAPVVTYYTVIWDANGGSCGTASSSVQSGNALSTVVNPLPSATKAGNTFDGWFTAINGGTQVTTSTVINNNVTYYAHYTPTGGGGCASVIISYTMTAECGNTGCEETATGTIGGTAYLYQVKNSSAPYKLNNDPKNSNPGSYFSLKLSTGYFQNGDTLIVDGSKAMHVYTGTHGAGTALGVTDGPSGGVIKYVLTSLPANTNEIYVYRDESTYNGTLTYLQVKRPCAASYTLSYDDNGGSGTMVDQEGTTLTVASNGFTAPTGYVFQKWNTSSNGGGTDYAPTNSITLTEDLTLYAIWQPQTYTVTLNQGSGSGGTANVTATFDDAMPSIMVPSRSGYTFAGYFTAANGEGTQYYDENGSSTNDWTIANNTTLYAYWIEGSAPAPSGCDLHFHFFYAADATSNGVTNDATVFTSMVSSGSEMAGSITIDGTSYSVTRRTGDNATFGTFTIPSGKTGTFYALAVSSGAGDRQINLVCGGTTYELPVEGGSGSYKRLEQGDLPAGTYSIEREGSSNVRLGVVVVKLCEDVSCASAYSFHYGPHTGDWETPICFEQVSATHEWQITDFTIPSHASGEFYVGYEGATNSQSATRAWTATYTEGNGAMKLLPTSTSIVGQATGAKGTISIWDDSGWQNQNVGFTPNGYGITYGGVGHAFNTTATANMLETDVVTLPDVSTTYTMGLATATTGTYVICAHSSAAEAISNMGVTVVAGGKKAIYLVPGSFNADGAKYAVYDITNAAFDTDFMSDSDGDGIYVGYVGSNCSSMILCRMSNTATTSDLSGKNWGAKWNQTADISISGDLAKKYTITSLNGDACAYTTVNMQPITGQKGKFRMWANSADNNWFVHWIPYYVLTYDANGGTGTTASTERNSESSTLTVNTASNGFTAPTGYQFDQWRTGASSGDYYAAGASYTLTANATLYAQWTPKTYTIDLNNQSATGAGTTSVSATYNSNANIVATITCPYKTGYYFDGYYTETNGGGTQLIDRNGNFIASVSGYTDASRNWIHDDDVTLYAKWTALIVTLTIAPSTIAPSTATNVTYTITTNAPTDTPVPYYYAVYNFGTPEHAGGYIDGDHLVSGSLSQTVSVTKTAGSWYTQAVIIWGGSVVQTSAKVELVAGTLYTVMFDTNGGSAQASISQASEGASISMPAAPTKSGYTFVNWVIGGTTFDPSDSYTPTANVTAYATWKENCAGGGGGTIISVALSGSNGATKIVTGSIGGSASANNLGSSSPYKLNGDGAYVAVTLTSGNYFQSGDVVTITGANKIHLLYAGTPGSGTYLGQSSTVESSTVTYTLPASLPSNTSTIYVYRPKSNPPGFDGTPNGTLSGMSVTRSGGTCYYVTYDGNGADGGFTNDPEAYSANDDPEVLANGFSKTDYEFTGWYTKAVNDGTGTAYSPGDNITDINANVTLYAQWAVPCSTPASPSSLTNGATTANTQVVTWTANGEDTWEVYYSTSSSTPDANQTPTATVNSATYTFTGLTASTQYYWWVRSKCDATHKSAWVSGSSFTTSAPPTYTLTVSGASVANPMTEASKTGAISGVSISGSPVSGISSGTTTSTSDNTFTVNKGTPVTVTASASVSGSAAECDECTYVFDHWTNVPATVTADVSNIQAVYNTTYTISFKETDESAVAGLSNTSYVYGVGKAANTLPEPTKSGYDFGGWYKENSLTNAATDIDNEAWGNVTYYAKWTEESDCIDLTQFGVQYKSGSNPRYLYAYTDNTFTNKYIIEADDSNTQGITFSSTDSLYLYLKNGKYATISASSTSTSAEFGDVTKVQFDFRIHSSGTRTLTLDVYVGDTKIGDVSQNVTDQTWYTKTIDISPAINGRVKIINTAGSSNQSVDLNNIQICQLPCTDAELAYAVTTINKGTSDASFTNTLTNPHGVTVSYTSSNPSVATVNATTGAVTIVGLGGTTITASAERQEISGDKYCADEVSYTLYVASTSYCDLLAYGIQNGSHDAIPASVGTITTTGGGSSDGYVKLSDDGKYFTVTAKSGSFAAGDKVSVRVYNKDTSNPKDLGFKIKSTSHTESVAKKSKDVVEYTLTAGDIEGNGTIKIYRSSSNDRYDAIWVERCEACDPPTITTQPVGGSYLIGATPSISVVASGTVTGYQWYSNDENNATTGTPIEGQTVGGYSPTTAIVGTTYYYCIVSNACGSVTSDVVAIIVGDGKEAPCASWTIAEPIHGGKGFSFSVIAKKHDCSTLWDGTLTSDMLTASSGVVLGELTVNNTTKTISGTYGVTSSATSPVTFYLTLPATGTQSAATLNQTRTFDACATGGSTTYTFESSQTGNPLGTYFDVTYSAGSGHTVAIASSLNDNNIKASDLDGGGSNFIGGTISTSEVSATITTKASYTDIDSIAFYENASDNSKPTYTFYVKDGDNTPIQIAELTHKTISTAITGKSSTSNKWNGRYVIDLSSAPKSGKLQIVVTCGSSGKYYALDNITIYEHSGAGTHTPTLVWSNSQSSGALVEKNEDAVDFTITANRNNADALATLGTINYTSSNTSVATINATTGKVTIADGIDFGGASYKETTITATLTGSGCYSKATITYILRVNKFVCTETAGTVSVKTDNGCSGVVLTVTGFETGATGFQWYKNGDPISGATSQDYTATSSGEYTVVTTKTCDVVSSNSYTVTIETATATKIVDEWYVKKDRRTPDIALVQTTNATGFTVSPTTIGGCSFYLGTDGIVYLKGEKDNGDEPAHGDGSWTAGNVDVTITATACANSSPVVITIHKQDATLKPSIAFVVDRSDVGGEVNDVSADKTTNRALWTYLSETFTLTGCNVYWTTNEKALRQYYSQYDAILITDDPSTKMLTTGKQDKGEKYKTEGYVNAFGTLIDVRPILTMEAYVSALANWSCVKGTPHSPSPRDYVMKLQCKEHAIYADLVEDGSLVRQETVDGIDNWYVTMVDRSNSTYSGTDDESDAEGTPALQGFDGKTNAGMLGIGTIADETLHGGIERQTQPAARMMVLGVNNKAMSALTTPGKQVIKNAISYLLHTDMESLEDCSNYFIGGTSGHETDWHTPENWTADKVPDPTVRARILAPCEISGVAHAASVDIAVGGRTIRYQSGARDCEGSLAINATGALVVTGGIHRIESAPNFGIDNLKPTTFADLHIKSTSGDGNGTLIFDNEEGDTKAIVEMYSRAQNSVDEWSWQYIAIPFNDNSSAYRNFYGSWLYRWAADNSGWEDVPNRAVVYPWIGYCLTQETAKLYYMDGTLVETGEQTFTVQNNHDMVIGNSWTAPIQVKQLTDDDFGGLTKNIYLFNTGMDENGEGEDRMNKGRYEAGTYVVVPIHSSPYTGDSLISSLQAFTVTNASGSDATLTLDYDRHVRPARSTDKVNAGPMHARQRDTDDNEPTVLKIWASGSHFDDRLVLIERSDFSTGYDSGWDGEKIMIGGAGPEIYSLMENGNMESVSAIDDLEGTIVGFRAGEDNEYTFRFEYSDEADDIYLLDTDERIYIHILTGNTYTFTTNDKVAHNRFIITHKAPYIPTGCDNTGAEGPKAKKFIADDKVYILLNGVLYDLMGKVVK